MREDLNDHSQRAHALLSASSSARWLACPPSAVAALAYEDTGSEYAAEGTTAHEVAEAVVRAALEGRPVPTFGDEVTPEMTDCAEEYWAFIQEHIKDEKAIVLTEQRVDFSPWVPEGFGTADCIIIQGETLTIIDYKYGRGVQVDAKENSQMMLYALGAVNDYALAYDIKTVEMCIFQPRINNVSIWSAKADDLVAWAENTVRRRAEQAAQGKGKHRAGEHCRFCPHAGHCRALTRACTTFVEAHGKKLPVEGLAPHEVADVLAMQPMIELWLKSVREQALKDIMDGKTIPGYKVVAGRGSRAWTDEAEVWKTLEGAGHSPDEFTVTELLSVAKMEKAIGKKGVAELLGELIEQRKGAPTVAPVSDKREPYDRLAEAQEDFK